MLTAAWLLQTQAAGAQQECETDAECGHGFVCETYVPGCVALPGAECPTEPASQCALGPCDTADDCAEGMVCLTDVDYRCDEAGESCGEAEVSSCAPPWQAPCELDSDCGEGFRCVEEMSCWCSGSAGRPPGDEGEPAPEPAEPECGCDPTGSYACERQEIACEDASMCPEGWRCAPNPERAVCSRPDSPGSPDSAGTGGASGADAPVTDSCGNADEPSQVCLPPDYAMAGSATGMGEASGAPEVDRANVDDGAGAPSDLQSAGTPGSADGGCQVGSGVALAHAGWLCLPALVLGARRRRAV